MGERAGSHIMLVGFSTAGGSVVSPDTTDERPHRSEDVYILLGEMTR
jgi:hypothetical protein